MFQWQSYTKIGIVFSQCVICYSLIVNNNLTQITAGTITLLSGFTINNANRHKLYKKAGVVSISINISGSISAGNIQIGSVPAGYFDIVTHSGVAFDVSISNSVPAILYVDSSGNIYVRTSYAMNYISGSIEFALFA